MMLNAELREYLTVRAPGMLKAVRSGEHNLGGYVLHNPPAFDSIGGLRTDVVLVFPKECLLSSVAAVSRRYWRTYDPSGDFICYVAFFRFCNSDYLWPGLNRTLPALDGLLASYAYKEQRRQRILQELARPSTVGRCDLKKAMEPKPTPNDKRLMRIVADEAVAWRVETGHPFYGSALFGYFHDLSQTRPWFIPAIAPLKAACETRWESRSIVSKGFRPVTQMELEE